MAINPDEIFKGLSQDPHLASYELLSRIVRTVLDRGDESAYVEACGLLEAFYETQKWKVPAPINVSGFGFGLVSVPGKGESVQSAIEKSRAEHKLQYEAFAAQIMNHYQTVVKKQAKDSLESAIAEAPGYAVLDGEEKKEIHRHLAKIRSIIEGSSLDDRKKNSLFERLSDLAREVDRNGTRTDRFFAFAGELSFYIGQFAENAKPAIEQAKSILKIIWRARERHDGTKLPRPDDELLLPEPKTE
jgi:hypothetical protein